MKSGSVVIVKIPSSHLGRGMIVEVNRIIDEHYIEVIINAEPLDIHKKIPRSDVREVLI